MLRDCGECVMCCVHFYIGEIDKPKNTPCPHLTKVGGEKNCTIYADRPSACARFRCGWLDGEGDDCDRPDRSHKFLLNEGPGVPRKGILDIPPETVQSLANYRKKV